MWNIHWNLRGTQERADWGFMDVESIEFGWTFLFEYFGGFYTFFFIWFPIYLIIIYGWWSLIIKNGYWWMIGYQFERGPLIAPLRKKKGEVVAVIGFIVQQYIYVTLFAIQTLPGFFFRWYSTIQLLFYTFLTIKNAGDYYIDYFAQNYETNLKQLDEIDSKCNLEYKRDNKSS